MKSPALDSYARNRVSVEASGVKWCMHFPSIAAVLLAGVSGLGASQDKPKPGDKNDVERCTPKVLSYAPERKTSQRLVRKGEKSNGYSPIVAFEILESGDVANAFVKRSSGFANVDNYALTWVREPKYNKRPGCGVIETQSLVTIDLQ